MRIDQAGKSAPNAAAARQRRIAANFVLPEEDEAARAESAAPAASLAPILLAEAEPPAPAAVADDAAAAQHGGAMLTAMSELQRAMLEGQDTEACRKLATLAEAMPSAADPGLRAILQSVALRAAVILARAD